MRLPSNSRRIRFCLERRKIQADISGWIFTRAWATTSIRWSKRDTRAAAKATRAGAGPITALPMAARVIWALANRFIQSIFGRCRMIGGIILLFGSEGWTPTGVSLFGGQRLEDQLLP